MSVFSAKSTAKVDNSAEVIAAANVCTPTATNVAGVNINHQLLTAEQLIAAGKSLQLKQELDNETACANYTEALALKQKQELLKVTNALAASQRHLATSTAKAAKAQEDLLFQQLDLEEAFDYGEEQLRLSKEIAAASAAMTLDDARVLLAERRAQAAQSNAAPQERSYTNNPGGSNPPKELKGPKAKAALVAAGFPEDQADYILTVKGAQPIDKYVKYLNDNGRASEVQRIAAVLSNPAHDYCAKFWKQYVAGSPAATSTTGFTSPASAKDTATPSTEGTGVEIPSKVGDVAGDIVDNTTH